MMNDIIKRYRRKPVEIEAAQVAEHTVATIAVWCGGSYGYEQDRGSDRYLELIVPNVEGNKKARTNQYVVRKSDGRFTVMTEIELKMQGEYEEVSKHPLLTSRPGALSTSVEVGRMPSAAEEGIIPSAAEPKTPHYVARGQYPFGN